MNEDKIKDIAINAIEENTLNPNLAAPSSRYLVQNHC